MRKTLALLLLIMMALCSLGSGRVDGEIKEFSWTGYPNVAPSANLLDCWVTVENSGDESAKFYIEIETVDGNGRVRESSCWPTPILQIGQRETIRSNSVNIANVRNSAEIRVKLYQSSCLHGNLLDSDTRMLTREKR